MNEDKENLVLNNQKLVYSVLKKYNNVHNEDLLQVGMIGLIKAAKLFDESRKTAFSSFAYKCISYEILMYFRKQNRKSFNDFANTISYNTLLENGCSTLEDCLGYTPNFDEELDKQELYKNINSLLSPIEKATIIGYYGLNNVPPLKQTELAKIFNVSQANIARILSRSKKKLKAAMEDYCV